MKDESKKSSPQRVIVPNAGLVLLNNYFLMLLERLQIISDNNFKTSDDQLNAVHYFQYIATGSTETDESLLLLNKVFSGLSPDAPLKGNVEMTEDQKQLIDGMIMAFIAQWTAIGSASVNGLRETWLVREGILSETEDRWDLTVKKAPFDMLLDRLPFSFSVIKLPWMKKPLHVTWR